MMVLLNMFNLHNGGIQHRKRNQQTAGIHWPVHQGFAIRNQAIPTRHVGHESPHLIAQ